MESDEFGPAASMLTLTSDARAYFAAFVSVRDNVIGGDFSRLRHPSVYASIGRPASALFPGLPARQPVSLMLIPIGGPGSRNPHLPASCSALCCGQDLQLVGMRTHPRTAKLIECCCE